jgi:hypothetical protein
MRTAQNLTTHISEAIAELRLTSTKEGARKLRGHGSDSTSQKSGELESSQNPDGDCKVTQMEVFLDRITICFELMILKLDTRQPNLSTGPGGLVVALVSAAVQFFLLILRNQGT